MWSTGNQGNDGIAANTSIARGGNIGWVKGTLDNSGEEYYSTTQGGPGVASVAPFNDLVVNKVFNYYWAGSSTPYFYHNYKDPSGSTSGQAFLISGSYYYVQAATPFCGGDAMYYSSTIAAGAGTLGGGGGAVNGGGTAQAGGGGNGGVLIFPVDMG